MPSPEQVLSAATISSRWKFIGDVGIAHILQAAVIVIGATVWLVSGLTKTESVGSGLQSLQQQVSLTTQQTREDIRVGMARVEGAIVNVQGQIAALPDLTARLRLMEIGLTRLEERADNADARYEQRRSTVDGRLEAIGGRTIETKAAVEAMIRASAVNLPGAPGVRR